jgi:endonuclease-8
MPEGDTIHKIAAAIQPRLEGEVIRRIRLRPGPRASVGDQLEAQLTGRRVDALYARGKHLFIQLEGGLALRSHLGMHGSWHRYRPGEAWRKPQWQASVALWTDSDVFVCFNAREVECLREGSFRRADLGRGLGPDLLAPEVDFDEILRRARELHGGEAPIVDVLLDQRVAGGIGNVYKSEVLFLAGLHPQAAAGQVQDATLRGVFGTARELMRRNLGGGRRVTRFVEDGRGTLWVYGRAGRPCLRCGAVISWARLGRNMRSTYWCPKCQEDEASAAVSGGG